MADTQIEWTDKVWNPVTGCTKVSQGCKNCYAERVFPRAYGSERKFTDVKFHPDRLIAPFGWKKPQRIFVNSMSDLFHEDLSFKSIGYVFAVMMLNPRHTFQVLTKRAERMQEFLSIDGIADRIALQALELTQTFGVSLPTEAVGRWPLPNVWLGVCALDWVVVGGESGPGRKPHTIRARPMRPSWARSLRDQCQRAGVPFLFKQWGEWASTTAQPVRGKHTGGGLYILQDGSAGCQGDWWDGRAEAVDIVGKKISGRLLDGREWNEYPAVTR